MRTTFYILTCLLILLIAFPIYAQSAVPLLAHTNKQSTILPILDQKSGKIEAFLYLDPLDLEDAIRNDVIASGKRLFPSSSTLSELGGDSLGLLCTNVTHGVAATIHLLAGHCMLARLANQDSHVSSITGLNPGNTAYGFTAGTSHKVPSALQLNNFPEIHSLPNKQIEGGDLTVFGLHTIGKEGFVAFRGTFIHAQLVSVADATPSLASRWTSRSLSLGGGYGAFSADIIGRVIDSPRIPDGLRGIDFRLSWHTPWSGHLSVGAKKITSRGRNPFAPNNSTDDSATIPYVRYEQEL